MKISVVTISYNQAEFLESCIQSVIQQDHRNIEYIIVDPGSTDGSRDIIQRYADHIDHILLEPDQGPSDGLNKGFAKATGDILYFINSDDIVLPQAFSKAVQIFTDCPETDVLLGNGWKIDKQGKKIKTVRIDRFNPRSYVYGVSVIFQQGMFFKRNAFEAIGGFNAENRIAWDSELLIDFAQAGYTFKHSKFCFGALRTYESTISERIQSDEGFKKKYLVNKNRTFEKVMGRSKKRHDRVLRYFYLCKKVIVNPHNLLKVFSRRSKTLW